jgi:ABC-type transport system substrate-binding protein
MRRSRVALAVLALGALALMAGSAACSGSGDSGVTGASSNPVKGGTLTVTFQGEPTGLDPAIAWEVESWSIERLTYQTFLTYASEPGEAGTKLVPDLATEVPTAANGGISDDGTVYTFHIKQGIKFAPPVNRDVTADDFKWSFERMMRQPLAPATFFYTGIIGAQDFVDGKASHIEGYKVLDSHTVQITLQKPDGAFLMAMSMPFTSVLPREWVKQVGKQIRRKPLGTGPYVIDTWSPGQEITAHRNPNWSQQGRQYLDGLKFVFSADPETALLKLERGEVDVLGDAIPAADYARTKANPSWGKNVVSAPQIAWYYIFMNVLQKPFDNVLVRQAVNYAIDPAKIEKLMAGQGNSLNQLYPDGMPGHQSDKQYYSYNPEKAKQLLSEAGYPSGFNTTFYTHNVEPFPKLAQAIQADLAAVGIEVDIKQMDRATYWDFISLQRSRAGIGLNDWYMDFPDPSDWIGPLFTQPIDGSSNSSFYENPEVDSLYESAVGETNTAKRLELFAKMQDIIMNDAPTVPLYQPLWNAMYGKTTGGFYIHPVWTFDFASYWKTDGK